MHRAPLRAAYAAATVSTLLALLPTEPALGHVDVRPRIVEQGKVAVLRIELPQLRPGAPPVELELEGDGVELLAGNRRQVAGAETVWSVRLRIGPSPPSGELPLVLRALFADGESVEVDSSVVVVAAQRPRPGRSFPWLPFVAAVTLALAVAAAVLIRSRRRSAW